MPKYESIKGFLMLVTIIALLIVVFRLVDQSQQNRIDHTQPICAFVLHRMPTTADSIDAMTMLDECMYTRDSLLPIVRGDALRDLPEQR